MLKQLFTNKIATPLWVLGAIFSIGLLSGCASKAPHYVPVKPKPSIAQIRNGYINHLEEQGVQVIQLGETIRLVIPSDRLFMANSANFTSYANPVLTTSAKLITSYDKVNVNVAAYSDNIKRSDHYAPPQRKQALTERQSQVVEDYLWSQHVDTRLLVSYGLGKLNPVAWNGSQVDRKYNRRVEISFQYYPKFNKYD